MRFENTPRTCDCLLCLYLQTTPFDSAPLEPLDEPPPQATVVPMATSILMQSPGNDMLSTKLAAAEDTISLLEKEKQRIQRVRVTCVYSVLDRLYTVDLYTYMYIHMYIYM